MSATLTAALAATDVNAAGSTPVIIIAAYADTNPGGIAGISGASSALSIQGRTQNTIPVANGLAALLDPAPTFAGSMTATETYTINAPTGGWTAAHNGTYFLALSGENVLEGPSQTPAAVPTAYGVFYIDVTPTPRPATPAVSLSASGSIAAQTTSETITATYADGGGITAITPGLVQISGPSGSAAGTLTATLNAPAPLTGSPATAQESYTVSPPAGGWTPADNGTYTVSLAAGTVSGVAVNATSTSFTVSVAPSGLAATATLTANLPHSVIGGQKSKVAATVVLTNPNPTILSGKATVTLYVSPTGSVSDGAFLASITKPLKLKGHKAAKFKLKVPSFPDLNGPYFLVAGISVDGSAVSAVGPSTQIAPPVVSFTPPAPVGVPQTVRAGGRLTVQFTLHDTGNIAAAGTAPVLISLSTQPDGSNATVVSTQPLRAQVKPRKLKVYKFKVKVPASTVPGTYYIAVSFDDKTLGDNNPADGSGVSSQPLTVEAAK